MAFIVSIDEYKLQITKDNSKNMYTGIFINSKNIPKIYGDNQKEVIKQAEIYIRGLHNELCRDQTG